MAPSRTARRARTFYLTRRGQLTDRYTKAIALLASEKVTERIGGIFAIEHLMAESAQDHPTAVEVLAAFVRERTRDLTRNPPCDPERTVHRPGPAADLQAALRGVDLREVKGLTAAQLAVARVDERTRLPAGTQADAPGVER